MIANVRGRTPKAQGMSDMGEAKERPEATRIGWACGVASLFLVVVTAAQWWIADNASPVALFALLGLAWAAFALAALWALYRAVRSNFGARAWVPVTVCLLALLCVLFVPFTDAWVRLNFHALLKEREDIVRQVMSGTLKPNVPHNLSLISLGRAAPKVSSGGNQIAVETLGGQPYIFFYTHRGVLDSYAGILYVPPGGEPSRYSELTKSNRLQVARLEGPWYYVANY